MMISIDVFWINLLCVNARFHWWITLMKAAIKWSNFSQITANSAVIETKPPKPDPLSLWRRDNIHQTQTASQSSELFWVLSFSRHGFSECGTSLMLKQEILWQGRKWPRVSPRAVTPRSATPLTRLRWHQWADKVMHRVHWPSSKTHTCLSKKRPHLYLFVVESRPMERNWYCNARAKVCVCLWCPGEEHDGDENRLFLVATARYHLRWESHCQDRHWIPFCSAAKVLMQGHGRQMSLDNQEMTLKNCLWNAREMWLQEALSFHDKFPSDKLSDQILMSGCFTACRVGAFVTKCSWQWFQTSCTESDYLLHTIKAALILHSMTANQLCKFISRKTSGVLQVPPAARWIASSSIDFNLLIAPHRIFCSERLSQGTERNFWSHGRCDYVCLSVCLSVCLIAKNESLVEVFLWGKMSKSHILQQVSVAWKPCSTLSSFWRNWSFIITGECKLQAILALWHTQKSLLCTTLTQQNTKGPIETASLSCIFVQTHCQCHFTANLHTTRHAPEEMFRCFQTERKISWILTPPRSFRRRTVMGGLTMDIFPLFIETKEQNLASAAQAAVWKWLWLHVHLHDTNGCGMSCSNWPPAFVTGFSHCTKMIPVRHTMSFRDFWSR